MKENPVKRLLEFGQSIWYDNITRAMIQSGELKRLIEEVGITGVTSNPTIFHKAISGSKDYDPAIRELVRQGIQDAKEIFLRLAMDDVSRAADWLWPVYARSKGMDGFVSIEVSPDLADDSEGTVAEARRIFSAIGKKNILIKVPGTKAGLPAIEELIDEGVNVNVTLLFSIRRYEEIAEAYIRGLERRAKAGKALDEVTSVASFFVSRLDSLVDPLLEAKWASARENSEKERIKNLQGKVAVANAKLAYQRYRQIFWGERFRRLAGAKVQRVLWASTGTKNPAYSDILYVQELIGPDSINTVPEATLRAFMDHGKAMVTVAQDLDRAQALFRDLERLGISIDELTSRLEADGVKAFSDSFTALLKEIRQKMDRL